jgi:hypothetical protein
MFERINFQSSYGIAVKLKKIANIFIDIILFGGGAGIMIRFNCEKCGQRYKADESFAGEEIECSKCNTMVSVPSMPESEELKVPTLTLPPSHAKNKEQKSADSPTLKLPPSLAKNKEQKSTKPPSLSLPKKMLEQETEEVPEEVYEKCPKCGATLQSANAVICIECEQNVKLGMNINSIKKAKVAGKLGLAIGTGAAAALLSGGIWAAIAVSIKMEIGWIACLVGLITGIAVCLVTQERSQRMGALAVLLACVGMLTGKMLTAEYLIRDTFKSVASITKKFSEVNKKMGKQFQNLALMGMLTEEMRDKGEIKNPYEELKKLAPKYGEKPSKAYLAAEKKANKQLKKNLSKVKKKFGTLSAADKERLQKKLERIALIIPLQQEMIDNGEIPKPDNKWKDLAPKSLKEKPSKEYLAAVNKYAMQIAKNMKKIKKKLYTLSDAEAERLTGKIGSIFSNQISYWQKLKMVTSYWDILWFLLAISTAWGLGNGTSSLSRQGL